MTVLTRMIRLVRCVCVSVCSAGMLLSVLVVLLLTFFYELLKVWRVWLQSRYQPHQALDSVPLSCSNDSSSILSISRSESSRTAIETLPSPDLNNRNRSELLFIAVILEILRAGLSFSRFSLFSACAHFFHLVFID